MGSILSLRLVVALVAAGLLFGPMQAMAAPIPVKGMPLRILDVIVTPHQFSDEFKYSHPPNPELGALVRLVVVHDGTEDRVVAPQLKFNGKDAATLLAEDVWAWYEMPDNLGTADAPFQMTPGMLTVFTFNAKPAAWGVGNTVELILTDGLSGDTADIALPITVDPLRLRSITCLATEPDGIIPERLVIHLSNDLDVPVTVRETAVYPEMQRHSRREASFETRPDNGTAQPGETMVVMADTGPLPLTHGLVEVMFETPDGTQHSRWARLRFKADRFDISSGWMAIATPKGVVPVTQESFLKMLKRMHVNSLWGEHIAGYTDDTGPDGLYTRFPMRQKGYFEDIEKYNADEWVARIHGVDRLGEPQHAGNPPMEVYNILKHYDAARYPTTLTLSDEKDWRYWAGIVDFPHYDAYRVSAPAMDNWRLYDCWDRTVFWGAPLEGIGVMTRSLRELSEPLPIALWSQTVHEGWQDQFTRLRRSPTPDEILMQAYQGLANGIISLYWYSLQAHSTLMYRDGIDITARIGREIRLLEDLYLRGYATHHERVMGTHRPDLEFNVVSAPDAALLFAMDTSYAPDHDKRVFVFDGPRDIDAAFPLPRWLQTPDDVFRVDADGVYDVDWSPTEEGVRIQDRLDRVGVYVVATLPGERERRAQRLDELKAYEDAVGFDPGNDDDDFDTLMRDLGYDDPAQFEVPN